MFRLIQAILLILHRVLQSLVFLLERIVGLLSHVDTILFIASLQISLELFHLQFQISNMNVAVGGLVGFRAVSYILCAVCIIQSAEDLFLIEFGD